MTLSGTDYLGKCKHLVKLLINNCTSLDMPGDVCVSHSCNPGHPEPLPFWWEAKNISPVLDFLTLSVVRFVGRYVTQLMCPLGYAHRVCTQTGKYTHAQKFSGHKNTQEKS